MSEDDGDLIQVLHSCILCGNGISKRYLSLLTSTIIGYADTFPDTLISTLNSIFCDFTSPFVPTRILLSIAKDLDSVPSGYFTPIAHNIIHNRSASAIFNAVFILPYAALNSSKASEVANSLLELLHQSIHQHEVFQSLAIAASQFMKKWAHDINTPENYVVSLLSLLDQPSLSFSTLSTLCQAAIYIIIAIIGDLSHLKDLIEDLKTKKPTPLDTCTTISNLNFTDYAIQTLPIAAIYQLIASFLFSVPQHTHVSIACHFSLIGTITPPTDEIACQAFYTMISALLKVMQKQINSKDLMQIYRLLDTQQDQHTELRNRCFVSIINCLKSLPDCCEVAETLFIELQHKSSSLLSLLIPFISFPLITKDFFLQLCETRSFRCLSEIYNNFPVSQEYSDVLFQKIESLPTAVQQSCLVSIINKRSNVLALLKNHLQSNQLSLHLSLAIIESSMSKRPIVNRALIYKAIHSWDFELRLSALRLLSVSQNSTFSSDEMSILYDAIPRILVFCDSRHEKVLEICLDNIFSRLSDSDFSKFTHKLFKSFTPFLMPHQSGIKKSYIINTLRLVWRHRPGAFLTEDFVKQLILSLFESSYSLRDTVFRCLIQSGQDFKTQFVNSLIIQYRNSERFREADGAARLIALQQHPNLVFEMWSDFTDEETHFPLSVILHFLEISPDFPIPFDFMTKKLLPTLCRVITDSLDFLGIERNVESAPIQAILTDTPPESQLEKNVNKAWLIIRQTLGILSVLINRSFLDLSLSLIKKIGRSLLGFLMESRHYSTVCHAHTTFQILCTRCFTRDDTRELPNKWCNYLVGSAGSFSPADHMASGGFSATAVALIRSEPVHLFAGQRPLYSKMLRACMRMLENPTMTNELTSALLLIQSIANDGQTQSNIEPYLPELMMALFNMIVQPMDYELRNTCYHCLTSLFNKLSSDFFSSVHGIQDFFLDHLNDIEQSDVSFLILQIIQIYENHFELDDFLPRICSLRSSPNTRVRRAAARAITKILSLESATSFVRQSLIDFEQSQDSNEMKGIVDQMSEIISKFPQLQSIEISLFKDIIAKHETNFIKLACSIFLAQIFDRLHELEPVLLAISHTPNILDLPLGDDLVMISFSLLSDEDICQLLSNCDLRIIRHLIRYLKKNGVESETIFSSMVELFLEGHFFSFSLLPTSFRPSKNQSERFLEILFDESKDERLVSLINHIPLFVTKHDQDLDPIFSNLIRFSLFVDRSDSGVLEALANTLLTFHELFNEFNPSSFSHWKLALRLISDESPKVRELTCRALSTHHEVVLCEFDLVHRIYKKIKAHRKILELFLDELREMHEEEDKEESDGAFKKEPIPFIHPLSFHIRCIEKHLSVCK